MNASTREISREISLSNASPVHVAGKFALNSRRNVLSFFHQIIEALRLMRNAINVIGIAQSAGQFDIAWRSFSLPLVKKNSEHRVKIS